MLNMDSPVFEGVRNDFATILNRLIAEIVKTGAQTGDVTIKIAVNIYDSFVGHEPVKVPTFEHKVSSSLSIKDQICGATDAMLTLKLNPLTGVYDATPLAGELFEPTEEE